MSISSDDNDCSEVDVNHPLHKISDFKSLAKVTCQIHSVFLTLIKGFHGRGLPLCHGEPAPDRVPAGRPLRGPRGRPPHLLPRPPGEYWPLIGQCGSRDLNANL